LFISINRPNMFITENYRIIGPTLDIDYLYQQCIKMHQCITCLYQLK
jgi:hypothetical protein